ncbi:MAG: hypothetical protein DMF83_10120 [Acidobacteria bacterium]|nr:MAG: hypothetical protein DMF83_10120 [Acidobacteriota bacterium]
MNTCAVAVLALAAPLAAASVPAASPSGGTAWLHVRVEELKQRSRVHVNLPLPAVEAALKAAPDLIASEGRIHLGGHGRHLDVDDFRQVWKELKTVGDAEIVSVEDGDDRVNVSKKGDLLLIRVQEGGDRETVHVDVPSALVDALFSGPGDELNVRAAIAELRKLRGDVVRVNDRSSTVRIWIDESAGAQGEK